jgi:Serine/threonine protein phosphatase
VLTRAVGTDAQVEIDVQALDWHAEDLLLLCSDGLTNMVSEEQIRAAAADDELELDDRAEHLIQLALEAGGEDNVTVVLLQDGGGDRGEERLS